MTVKEKITVQNIVDGVIEMIKNGEFQPGEPIREAELCKKFDVSRTPIREAIRLLQNNGIVEYIPRCGVQVVELSMKDLIYSTDIRTVIEVLSSQKAAENVTEEDIQKLREINGRFFNAVGAEEQANLDQEFHSYIAEMSQNPWILRYLNDLRIRHIMLRLQVPFKQERIAFSYQEHENIIQALEWRDADLAGKQTEIHFQMSQKSLQKKMMEYESKKYNK